MRALVLDFDGLIMDTETTDFQSWLEIYERHGVPLDREEWVAAIGTDGMALNPARRLSDATGAPEAELRAARREVRDALIADLQPLPGVCDWLEKAQERGMAVASSSPRSWVEGHLARVGLLRRFPVLATAEDVDRVKPHPAVYRAAIRRLGVGARETLALEDSPNGLAAARAAGVACIAVPGPMTAGLAFDDARLVLDSLAQRSLSSVLSEIGAA